MSLDELVIERERLFEAWDEAVGGFLRDLEGFVRLTQQRALIQAEMHALNDVYGAIGAAGSSVEGDRRHAETTSALVTLRIRYAFELEIVEATALLRQVDALQPLAAQRQAVLSELKRWLPAEYSDELETFQKAADLGIEFLQMQLTDSHDRWQGSWRAAIETQRLGAGQLEQIAPGSAASWRFNAPPGWPQPQPGWSPGPDWLPDPSWDVPEKDWHFWTRD
ncbi:hypothetical protein ABZ806_05030 [Spirillospora sp. NPDC047418]|jgi:hypothetical protein